MSESPIQSRQTNVGGASKAKVGIFQYLNSLLFANNVNTLGSAGIGGAFHGQGEYISTHGKFKGHHREFRRSQFKRTMQKR